MCETKEKQLWNKETKVKQMKNKGQSKKGELGWNSEIRQVAQYPANDIRDTSGIHLTDDKSDTKH